MLVNYLPQLMKQRQFSIRQLSRATGITYTTIRAVYHSQRRSVQLEVLDAICEALQVQPGDIYRHVAAADQRTREVFEESTAPLSETDSEQAPPQRVKSGSGGDWRSW
ncbi:MAG TPA: helix-turn-helix transcriptional regulator [Anaerolineae bacterium]|jgi:putative transcriptional regulator|nr:helix-turn-helix transcriptional regulator [Anaerolineae bacterium]